MSQFAMADLARLIVVLVIVVGGTVLAYVGKIDAMVVQTIYFTAAAYVFGYAHGAASNGGPPKGG